MTATLKVYTTAGALVATLSAIKEPRWRQRGRNDPGLGSFKIPHSLVTGSLADTDNVVRIDIGGTERIGWLIRPDKRDSNPSGGMRSLSGPGVIQLLDLGLIYPPGGMSGGMTDVKQILFGWPHPEFDDTAWGAPSSWGTVQSLPSASLPTPRPVGFPDGSAQLITSSAVLGTAGRVDYHRTTFTLASQTRMGFYQASDDEHDAYLEGALISSQRGPNRGDRYTTAIYDLPPGTYTYGAMNRNLNRGSNVLNAMWFCASGIELDSNDEPTGTVIFRTDTTNWKMLSNPATPPGLNLGVLLRVWREQAQARGATKLDDVTDDFTDTLNSDGDAWVTEFNIPVAVGTDLATAVLRILPNYGAADVKMTPALVLQAREGYGTDRTATKDFTFASGRTGPGAPWSKPGDIANVLLTRGAGGEVTEHTDATSITANGRYERALSLSSEVDTSARADQALKDGTAGYEETVWRVCEEDSGYLPFDPLELGDTVSGDDASGASATWQLDGFDMAMTRGGALLWDLHAVKQP